MLTKPAYGTLFFEADSGNAAGNSTESQNDAGKDAQPGGQQGEPEGFKPIQSEAELAAWKGSTRKAILEEVRADLKREQDQRDADAKAEADRKAAEERGAFDEVKQSLTKERDDAKAAETELRGKVEKYEAIATKQVDALKGELPAEAIEDFPVDADPVAQLEWLDARKALVAKLAPAVANGTGHPRVPETPKPNAQAPGVTKEQQAAIDRQYRVGF